MPPDGLYPFKKNKSVFVVVADMCDNEYKQIHTCELCGLFMF